MQRTRREALIASAKLAISECTCPEGHGEDVVCADCTNEFGGHIECARCAERWSWTASPTLTPEEYLEEINNSDNKFNLDRMKDAQFAAAWGVWCALMTSKHLGDAARELGFKSRTVKGDAFEHAFEWAREMQKDDGASRL